MQQVIKALTGLGTYSGGPCLHEGEGPLLADERVDEVVVVDDALMMTIRLNVSGLAVNLASLVSVLPLCPSATSDSLTHSLQWVELRGVAARCCQW